MDGASVIPGRCDREIERVLLGVAAPQHGASDQVLDRVDLIFVGAKHATRIGNRGSKLQERCLHLFEACLIPIGGFERAGAFLAELDRILQGVDLPDILLAREIDQETDDGNSIARANHLPGKSVSARAVIGGWGVLILIDDLHPHVALARLRQRDRHPPGIEVDNRKRIQRVAVGTDNALLDGRSQLAAMSEFSETTVLDHPGEINIGLGAVVVLDGDGLSR